MEDRSEACVAVAVAGLAIYLVLPSITEVFASWPLCPRSIPSGSPPPCSSRWPTSPAPSLCSGSDFAPEAGSQSPRRPSPGMRSRASCRQATSPGPWSSSACSPQPESILTSLSEGLTAFSLLGVGGLLALPIFALPAIVFGGPVNRGLLQAALLGVGGFCLFAGFGAVVLVTNRPLVLVGRFVQRVRNRLFQNRPPLADLDVRLIRQRDAIREVLGKHLGPGGALCRPTRSISACWRLARDREPPAALARPPGLRRLRNRRPGPDHTGRTRRRRGELERSVDSRQRRLG